MCARQLMDGASFGPDALDVINHAFDAAWLNIAGPPFCPSSQPVTGDGTHPGCPVICGYGRRGSVARTARSAERCLRRTTALAVLRQTLANVEGNFGDAVVPFILNDD